jgi:hypothetical protein
VKLVKRCLVAFVALFACVTISSSALAAGQAPVPVAHASAGPGGFCVQLIVGRSMQPVFCVPFLV